MIAVGETGLGECLDFIGMEERRGTDGAMKMSWCGSEGRKMRTSEW